ncbi:PP2C family protein-serine/threonine phosphatase [Streptomyces sp. SP18CS02]|uniref:PP2C family protein-serine/threonine phosphatase n=1 Tax=Streptomyces sp. SP18CS02 TaxID=3002531 RepID=UPI002E78CDA2|nr:PP2C family protein-serine/threonine phosphatase [Streptomyces sp. SP18CS02]MEE1754141.1 PP2C family protein-serine/threonine phosphatase [Streptomyces sp. SP18CS02]
MGQRARDGGGRGGLVRSPRGSRAPGPGRDREGVHLFIRSLPALMIIGGVIYDVSTPSRFTAVPLFAAAPLIAAPFFSFGATLLAGLVALVAVVVLRLHGGTMDEAPALTEVVTIGTVSALALFINRVVRRGGERLASARVIAETAQRAVLPSPAKRIGGLDIAARYEAAQADTYIGGDLFAVQDTPYGVRLVVGDVRGKGLGAVEAVAVVIGAFREAAEQESSLEGVAQRLERALAREGTRRDGLDAFEGFTTAVLAEIPRGDTVVRIVDRGHPEPLRMNPDATVELLEPNETALPLGMADLAAWPDRAYEVSYPPGATLLFYTDGLSEARDARGEFYDPVARLAGRVFPGPEALLDALVEDVRRHTGGGATDDLALLAVSRPEEGQPDRRTTIPLVP